MGNLKDLRNKRVPNKNYYNKRRKHPCVFCSRYQAKLKRHILTQHTRELEVQNILKLSGKEQNRFIERWRKEGIRKANLCRLDEGKNVLLREKKDEHDEPPIMCNGCKGFFPPSFKTKHEKTCKKNNKSWLPIAFIQSQAYADFSKNFKALLNTLSEDVIGNYIKTDDIVLMFGSRYFEEARKSKTDKQAVKSRMRVMSKLYLLFKQSYEGQNEIVLENRTDNAADMFRRETMMLLRKPMIDIHIGNAIELIQEDICLLPNRKCDIKIALLDLVKSASTFLIEYFVSKNDRPRSQRVAAFVQDLHLLEKEFGDTSAILSSAPNCRKHANKGRNHVKKHRSHAKDDRNRVKEEDKIHAKERRNHHDQEHRNLIKEDRNHVKEETNHAKEDGKSIDWTSDKHVDVLIVKCIEVMNSEDVLKLNAGQFANVRAATATFLTIFNARRGCEPAILVCRQWKEALSEDWVDADILTEDLNNNIDNLNSNYAVNNGLLVTFQTRKGLDHELGLVPVLFPRQCHKAMNYLTNGNIREKAYVNLMNDYIFADTKQSLSHVNEMLCIDHVLKDLNSIGGIDENTNKRIIFSLVAKLRFTDGEDEEKVFGRDITETVNKVKDSATANVAQPTEEFPDEIDQIKDGNEERKPLEIIRSNTADANLLRSEMRQKLKRPISVKQQVASASRTKTPGKNLQPDTNDNIKVSRSGQAASYTNILVKERSSSVEVAANDFTKECITKVQIKNESIASEDENKRNDSHTTSKMDAPSAKRRKQKPSTIDKKLISTVTAIVPATLSTTTTQPRNSSRNRESVLINCTKESKTDSAYVKNDDSTALNICQAESVVADATVKNCSTVKRQDIEASTISNGKRKMMDVTKKKKENKGEFVLKSKTWSINCTDSKKDPVETAKTDVKMKTLNGRKMQKKNIRTTNEDSDRSSEDDIKFQIEQFCSVCEQSKGEMVSCNGDCFRSFHIECLVSSNCTNHPNIIVKQDCFSCDECQRDCHQCFQCKKSDGNVVKCTHDQCGKFYHDECIAGLSTKGLGICDDKKLRSAKRFICPHHCCKMCVRTNAFKYRTSVTDNYRQDSKQNALVKCIRCPTAYHRESCLVAGCTILTSQHMICSQHFDVKKNTKRNLAHVNVTWCFVCSAGGSLVCCDTCPASFHPECTDVLTGVPEGAWQCQDCIQHNKPKYGEIVWAKFGVYRWWPAKICFLNKVPGQIHGLAHSPGEFPVMFFGSRDYAWLHSGRVFRYEDGDNGGRLKSCKLLDTRFEKALEEAKQAYKDYKSEETRIHENSSTINLAKPPSYKHIKMNRVVSCIRTVLDRSEWPVCECTRDGPCTDESKCLNRLLYFECNVSTCKAGTKCQNQRMQRCQYKKLTKFKCDDRGWGIKSKQEIDSGDFVIEYVGELIDSETCQKRVKEYHEAGITDYYFLTIDRDNIIDAYPKGNLSRFTNHSCDPNCEAQKWTVNGEIRVGVFATRKIASGEELCFNYRFDCMGNEKKECKCGSANCSGFLGVKPKSQRALSMAEKAEKKRKREDEERKKLKVQKKEEKSIVHDDECFICADGGDLILCSRVKCTKVYHLDCLSLRKNPHAKWQCPWHLCNVCGKFTADSLCALCPTSYCKAHKADDMFMLPEEDGFVCSSHSDSEVETLLARLEKQNHLTSSASGP